MNTYIVLLRGVNVGGNNLLPMKDLKRVMADGGFENVQVYIQSGNIVVARPSNPTAEISALIESNFGFKPEIMAISSDAYKLAMQNNPYQEFEGKCVHFYFCNAEPALDMKKVEALSSETERCQLIGHVFYLHAPDGIGRSKLVSRIEACLGVTATGRNLNTVNKIKGMIENI